ncbi:uncharacterized protein LOC119395989 [Rhipicephalus sanguineus]|uniref:uncharacterized protein LOC119395989 n=1 Tax=Rhipicephalus sanguineus TaxID=34632 RepID=UPI001895E530|nr:uncharacterized protein LOC119395989 [Rhipicephalus sanguineus]
MRLLNELSNVKQLLAASTSKKFVAALPGDCPDLPAKDFQEVLSLEKYLATDSHMEQMVEYYSRYGGTDPGHAVRTLLQNLLSKEAVLKFSWKGSQGRKHAFSELTAIVNFMLTLVRSSFPSASLEAVSGTTKRWLVGAVDRAGGRNERRHRGPV